MLAAPGAARRRRAANAVNQQRRRQPGEQRDGAARRRGGRGESASALTVLLRAASPQWPARAWSHATNAQRQGDGQADRGEGDRRRALQSTSQARDW